MFSLVGMMLFATSNDLLTMFVALEVLRFRSTCCAASLAVAGC